MVVDTLPPDVRPGAQPGLRSDVADLALADAPARA